MMVISIVHITSLSVAPLGLSQVEAAEEEGGLRQLKKTTKTLTNNNDEYCMYNPEFCIYNNDKYCIYNPTQGVAPLGVSQVEAAAGEGGLRQSKNLTKTLTDNNKETRMICLALTLLMAMT